MSAVLNDGGQARAERTAVCLMGPTAAGKTGVAVALCKRFPFEIVSVDSALVYRGMDIGTAKPDAETLLVTGRDISGAHRTDLLIYATRKSLIRQVILYAMRVLPWMKLLRPDEFRCWWAAPCCIFAR